MKENFVGLLFITMLSQLNVFAQKPSRTNRFQIILDCSHNMSEKWADGKSRLAGSKDFILQIMEEAYKMDSTIEFALRAIGHQYPVSNYNCFDSKQEVYFSRDNYEQMTMRLNNLSPLGVSSVAYAIKNVPRYIDFRDGHQYAIILITATGESCSGRFCDELQKVINDFDNLPIYVLQYNNSKTPEMSCVKNYFQISEAKNMAEAVRKILGNPTYKNQFHTVEHTPDSSGFGFIQIKNVFHAKILGLSYAAGNRYIPFTQLSLTNTNARHKLRIKTGKYRIEYHDLRNNVKAMEFTISPDDTTRIDLK